MNWLDPSCPWHGWELANLMTCELRQCAWIRQPGNTLSNLGFWVAAAAIWWRFRTTRFQTDRDFAILAFCTGLASGLAHASQAWFFSFFDFGFTGTLFFYCLGLNLQRWFKNKWGSWPWWRIALFAFSFVTPLLHLSHTLLLLGVVAGATLWSGLKAQSFEPIYERKLLFTSLGTLTLAVLVFSLDASKTICLEYHWLNLHAAWHGLTALSLWFMAAHYRSLQKLTGRH